MSNHILAPPDGVPEPFALNFGMKAVQEVTRDGIVGLLTQGYASLYNVEDLSGEQQEPDGFLDIDDTWGRQARPAVDFEHGLDPVLRTAAIGWGVKYQRTADGLYAECFLPREPTPPFTQDAGAKNARWAQVYAGILAGKIRGYSVQGTYQRAGKALKRWSMNILTITGRPCLPSAQFALGSKAVQSMLNYADAGPLSPPEYANTQPLPEQSAMGTLSRPAFGQVMGTAQKFGDKELHDHLLNRAPHLQGPHSPESCPICTDRRTMMGVKMLPWGIEQGAKATKDGPDSDYLAVDSDGGQRLRVKKNGTPDHGLMGGAYAALTSNHRGQPYAGPDKMAALAKLRKLYASEDMDWPADAESGKKSELVAQAEAVAGEYQQRIATLLAGQKAGKKISTATRTQLQGHADTLGKIQQALEDLISDGEGLSGDTGDDQG